VDPCSKKTKTIYISGNENVTVNYLGYINTFNRNDFQTGAFEGWIQSVQVQAAGKPCDEMKTQTQKSQNMFITQNLISTLTSVTAASTMTVANASSSALSNSVGNAANEKSESPKSNKKDKNDGNNNTTGNQTNTTSNQTTGQNSGSVSTSSNTGGNTNQTGGNNSSSTQSTQNGNTQTQPSVTPSSQNTGTNPSSNPSSNSSSNPSSSSTNNSPKTNSNSPNNEQNSSQNGQNNSTTQGNGNSNSPKTETNTNNSGNNTGNSGSSSGSNTGQNGQNTNNSGNNTGNSGGGGNGQQTTPQKDNVTDKKTEGGSGNAISNSVSNAAEATSGSGSSGGGKSNLKVGSIIGTGDIVAIRSEEDGSSQFRGTMSVTKSNTDNTRAKGSLLNFTTTVNNTNLTFYAAFSNKKRTNTLIMANSSMVDRDWNFFNTTTALESKRFNKLSLMGGLNFTAGALYDEPFTNLSAVMGGFYPFKASNKLSGNLLVLGVYSPFTKFYEGKWWTSGWLVVPFSSWDYTISKNFKYNVSFSGTYEVKGNFLQYQILTGGKILL
jgi:hypothetical protein